MNSNLSGSKNHVAVVVDDRDTTDNVSVSGTDGKHDNSVFVNDNSSGGNKVNVSEDNNNNNVEGFNSLRKNPKVGNIAATKTNTNENEVIAVPAEQDEESKSGVDVVIGCSSGSIKDTENNKNNAEGHHRQRKRKRKHSHTHKKNVTANPAEHCEKSNKDVAIIDVSSKRIRNDDATKTDNNKNYVTDDVAVAAVQHEAVNNFVAIVAGSSIEADINTVENVNSQRENLKDGNTAAMKTNNKNEVGNVAGSNDIYMEKKTENDNDNNNNAEDRNKQRKHKRKHKHKHKKNITKEKSVKDVVIITGRSSSGGGDVNKITLTESNNNNAEDVNNQSENLQVGNVAAVKTNNNQTIIAAVAVEHHEKSKNDDSILSSAVKNENELENNNNNTAEGIDSQHPAEQHEKPKNDFANVDISTKSVHNEDTEAVVSQFEKSKKTNNKNNVVPIVAVEAEQHEKANKESEIGNNNKNAESLDRHRKRKKNVDDCCTGGNIENETANSKYATVGNTVATKTNDVANVKMENKTENDNNHNKNAEDLNKQRKRKHKPKPKVTTHKKTNNDIANVADCSSSGALIEESDSVEGVNSQGENLQVGNTVATKSNNNNNKTNITAVPVEHHENDVANVVGISSGVNIEKKDENNSEDLNEQRKRVDKPKNNETTAKAAEQHEKTENDNTAEGVDSQHRKPKVDNTASINIKNNNNNNKNNATATTAAEQHEDSDNDDIVAANIFERTYNRMPKWIFTEEQIENTPSRRSEMRKDQEYQYRQRAAYFIYQMGQRLNVSQLAINTAIVFMQRFYMHHSFMHFHWINMAASTLLLACKVEEIPRQLKHFIIVINNGHFPATQRLYTEQTEDILLNETILLKTLGFRVTTVHPHVHILKICKKLCISREIVEVAYFLASNTLHLTLMCLKYPAPVVACYCIYQTFRWLQWEILQSDEGKLWFNYVDKNITYELLHAMSKEFVYFYQISSNMIDNHAVVKSGNSNPVDDKNTT